MDSRVGIPTSQNLGLELSRNSVYVTCYILSWNTLSVGGGPGPPDWFGSGTVLDPFQRFLDRTGQRVVFYNPWVATVAKHTTAGMFAGLCTIKSFVR